MNPIFVSFYTPGPYEAEAQLLEHSCRAFGLETDIQPLPCLGDWTLNCGQKPAYVRQMMQQHPGRRIVWLDADARVRQMPTLFDELDCDFAAHWRHGEELLSGTLFFSGSHASWELVNQWCAVQQATPGAWDQKNLQWLLERFPNRWRVERLPPEYTRVFDDAKMGEPVVWHGQASRRLAKGVA